jgi:alcohol dehydrogenase class IV
LRPDIAGQPEKESARICSQILTDFIRSLGLQLGLKQFVSAEDIPALVAGVAGDLSINPVPIRGEDLDQVFHEVLEEDES